MSRSPVSEFLKTQNTEIPASASASHRARASDRGRARLEKPEPPVPALLSPQAAQFQGGHRTQSSQQWAQTQISRARTNQSSLWPREINNEEKVSRP